MFYTHFRANLHSAVAGMSKNSLLKKVAISEVLLSATRVEPITTQLINKNSFSPIRNIKLIYCFHANV